MKTLNLLAAAAASVIAVSAAGAASAQAWGPGHWQDGQGRWMNVNQRQAQLDRRIDMGVRNGQLTRSEAVRLRSEFRDIARLEHRYRANGLSNWERADLDRRFDRLASEIRWERRDGQRYGYGYGPGYRR